MKLSKREADKIAREFGIYIPLVRKKGESDWSVDIPKFAAPVLIKFKVASYFETKEDFKRAVLAHFERINTERQKH